MVAIKVSQGDKKPVPRLAPTLTLYDWLQFFFGGSLTDEIMSIYMRSYFR